jgi:hypothetical protein
MDRGAVQGTILVDGAYLTQAMDHIVSNALSQEVDWERLVIYEHDMIPPLDAFNRIANEYPPDADIVGSFYFRHEPPHNAVVYIQQPDDSYGPLTSETVKEWTDKPALYAIDAVGFGFTSIHRSVLEDWDKSIPMFSMDETYGSHDLWFCHHAIEQGFNLSVDSGIVCGHLTKWATIGLKDNQEKSFMTEEEAIACFSFNTDGRKVLKAHETEYVVTDPED